jgi:hypothetical protein
MDSLFLERVMTDDDLRTRTRILKLRWMGLEDEAERLARSLRERIGNAPPCTQHLPRRWMETD